VSVQELAADLRCKIAIGPETQAWKRTVWAAALGLALESYELGVSAGLDQIAPTGSATRAITRWEHDPIAMGRAEIERLAQGEPAADDTPEAPHVLAPSSGVGEAAGD